MSELSLSAAFADHDRIAPLRSGAVRPEGIHLEVLILPPSEIFRRMCRDREFQISEMSMGAHMYLTGTGDCPFVALPAFLSRAFRHAMVYAHVDSGIHAAEDLNGKRIVLPEWGMTAVVWILGILGDEHGLDLASVQWVAEREPRVPIPMPEGLRIRYTQPGENLSDLLDSGRVDAALSHEVPACFAAGSERVTRVFPDYEQAERDYHRRTGVHPVMHCAVVRRDVKRRHPWAAKSLYDALCRARARTMQGLLDTGVPAAMVPFLPAVMDDTRRTFGDDFWPYGMESNRRDLERLVAYGHQQGLTPRLLRVEELFDETVQG